MTEGDWGESVDELLRIRRKKGGRAPEASYRSDARRVLDGRWVGRYAQSVILTRPAWMDVHFSVRATGGGDGLFGKGKDGIGDFEMEGVVSGDDAVRLVKRYIGGHLVHYNGVLEDRALRGVWTISATNYGLFAFHHEADLDRSCLPKPPGSFARLLNRLFFSEPPFDAYRHQQLVDRFRDLRPDLRHARLPYP